ncbi:hypothetical protein EIN_525440, partial [Entamoeba invadens IP1]
TKFYVMTKSGDIYRYGRNFLIPADRYSFPKFTGASIFIRSQEVIGWDTSKVCGFDFGGGEVVSKWEHKTEICGEMYNKISESQIAGVMADNTIEVFDYRSDTVIYKLGKRPERLTAYDTFDDYFVIGGEDGWLEMFDRRKDNIKIDTKIKFGRINVIKCANKMILAGEGNVVSFYDLKGGNFGVGTQLYIHNSLVTAIDIGDDHCMSGSSQGELIYYKYL